MLIADEEHSGQNTFGPLVATSISWHEIVRCGDSTTLSKSRAPPHRRAEDGHRGFGALDAQGALRTLETFSPTLLLGCRIGRCRSKDVIAEEIWELLSDLGLHVPVVRSSDGIALGQHSSGSGTTPRTSSPSVPDGGRGCEQATRSAEVIQGRVRTPASRPSRCRRAAGRTFDQPAAEAINMARLEHLDSLNLPLRGKRVLDLPGSGVGHLAQFFVERGCEVVCVDGRGAGEHRARLGSSTPGARAGRCRRVETAHRVRRSTCLCARAAWPVWKAPCEVAAAWSRSVAGCFCWRRWFVTTISRSPPGRRDEDRRPGTAQVGHRPRRAMWR